MAVPTRRLHREGTSRRTTLPYDIYVIFFLSYRHSLMHLLRYLLKAGGARVCPFPPVARYITENNLAVSYGSLAPGDLVFYSFGVNNRYLNAEGGRGEGVPVPASGRCMFIPCRACRTGQCCPCCRWGSYYAENVFHLTDEQMQTAEEYAANLHLFLFDTVYLVEINPDLIFHR